MQPHEDRLVPGWIVPCLLVGYVLCYLVAGVYTESRLGAALMQDFVHYQNAFFRFEAGESPYALRHVGLGFLYPLPALFIVEAFSLIKPFNLMATVYIAVNVALIIAMVYGLTRHYGFRLRQIWWWYPLCLGFAPLLETLHLGQINFITLFGIFLLFVGRGGGGGTALRSRRRGFMFSGADQSVASAVLCLPRV